MHLLEMKVLPCEAAALSRSSYSISTEPTMQPLLSPVNLIERELGFSLEGGF